MNHEHLFKCKFGAETKNIRVLSVHTDEQIVKDMLLAYFSNTTGIIPDSIERIPAWAEMADELIRF